MNLKITVYNEFGNHIYKKEIRGFNGPIARIGETICFGDGEAVTIKRVEWDYEKNSVCIVCS